MRTAFIEELIIQARANERVFLVVGDLGYSVVEPFANEFPDRFLNAGVAEQNMTGIAAGLASEGYHVFTYSIANFPTFRCAEQIRNDIAYQRLAVTVVAVGGGFAYGNLGYSHHAVQDYALMRSFPGMLLAAPGDPQETRACVRFLVSNPSPSYLRLGKAGEPVVHERPLAVQAGALIAVHGKNSPHAILTTGATLKTAVDAVATFPQAPWAVYSLPLWNSPLDGEMVRAFVERHESILVLEDHLAAGGFVSYIRECLGNRGDLQARVAGLSLSAAACELVASQRAMNAAGGLSAEAVAERMRLLRRV